MLETCMQLPSWKWGIQSKKFLLTQALQFELLGLVARQELLLVQSVKSGGSFLKKKLN